MRGRKPKFPLRQLEVGDRIIAKGASATLVWRAGQSLGRKFRSRLLTTGREIRRVS